MKEKLFELIVYGKKKCEEYLTCRECAYDYGDENCIDLMTVDHLIANNVTIKKQGKWIKDESIKSDYYSWFCSECATNLLEKTDYCPHCGADMRGASHD